MSNYQIRGATGVNPKKNYLAEEYAKAETLPAMMSDEYNRRATDRSLDLAEKTAEQNRLYNEQSLALSREANESAEADRKRGLMLQGGMAGISGYNALNDSVGGDLGGKTMEGVRGLVADSGSISGGGYMGEFPGQESSLVDDALSTAADYGKEYFVEPIVNAATYVKDAVGDAVSGAVDYVGGLFS